MRKKGVALIVVLVLVVLLSALILAVVLSATMAIRKAHYYTDKTIALEIAKSGIQDCFYWMNYRGYEIYGYPCSKWNGVTWDYDSSYKYFRGSDYTAGPDVWTNGPPSLSDPYYQPVKGLTKPNFCKLEFEDRSDTDMDEIISTGYYNGKKATIRVRIRGCNGNGNHLHNTGGRYLKDGHWDGVNYKGGVATWGVAEGFNKHIVYAHLVQTASTSTVEGNIAYYDSASTFPTSGDKWTKTKLPYDITDNDMVRVESSLYIPTDPSPGAPPYDAVYVDTGGPYPYSLDPDGAGPAPEVEVLSPNLFEFSDGDTITVKIEIQGDARFTGNMGIEDYVKVTGGGATIRDNVKVTSFVNCDGSISINGNTHITGSVSSTCLKGNGISILSASVMMETGILHSTGNITINVNNTNEFCGVFYSEGGTIDLRNCKIGTSLAPSNVVTTGILSRIEMRGVTLYGTAYSQGSISLLPSDNTVIAGPSGIALCLDRISGSSSILVSNTSHDVIKGLIISRGDISSVLLYNVDFVGTVISDGTVSLGHNTSTSTFRFDTQRFKTEPIIYNNCKGGRRVYLPVPGSWKIEW